MENMVRISVGLPEIKPCAVETNVRRISKLISRFADKQPNIILFPAYSLTGASCGSMFNSKDMMSKLKNAVASIADMTKNTKIFIILGLPKLNGDSAAAVIYNGEILKVTDGKTDNIIKKGNLSFMIHLGKSDGLLNTVIDNDIDLIISMSALESKIGTRKKETDFYKAFSRARNIAIAAANGNIGETTSPYIYNPYAFVVEKGEILFETMYDEQSVTADIDLDIIKHGKDVPSDITVNEESFETPYDFFRNPKCNPFLPADVARRRLALDEMFDFQVKSLVSRMQASQIKKLAIGVSGGVDSTLALMVAVKALDELKYPRTNLIGITMPGFGTNDRTYYNALKLIVGFKAELREIPIKSAVLKHFEDIGHDPALHNATFENAQARERAQILLDIANTENAIIVGTGDLSEDALGWFTFCGDQIAHFNVNQSIPKTVVREIINRQMALAPFESEADLLSDIVLTPISPELLPSENGDFAQKTETIIGPYELHDFFIYYFVRYGFAPKKLFEYARHAFFGVYEDKEILDTMKIFFRRFLSNQFKRSANPDGANFGEISLASCDMNFPSDLDVSVLLQEIEKLTLKDNNFTKRTSVF